MTSQDTTKTAMSQAARGHLAMLSFSALVAGSFSLGAMASGFVSPSALMAVRFLIGAILIGALAPMLGLRNRDVLVAPWRYFVLAGLYAFYFVLMYKALETASAVSISAVFTLTPFLSAGFAWLVLRQITTSRMALALGIGCTGAIWVIFQADLSALLAFRLGHGEFIFFWGVVAHALYTPLARKLNRGEHPVIMTLGTLIAGFIILVIYSWGDLVATDWTAVPAIVWILLAYISVCSGAVSLLLIQYATLRLPSAKVMAYTYLVPSWVILWEITLGHGAPKPLILAGVVLTVVALLMLLRED